MDKSNSSDTPNVATGSMATSAIHSKVNYIVMPTMQKTIRNETLSTGLHTFDELDDVDLPEYVQEHNQVLSFPEKVSIFLFWTSVPCLPIIFMDSPSLTHLDLLLTISSCSC